MRAQARAFTLLVGMLLALACCDAANGASQAVQGPSALIVTVPLQPLPADGGTYPSVVVALNDPSGNPTIALSTMTVFLSSSQQGTATVAGSVDLLAGHSFVLVNVTTTQRSGSTTITAASSGLKSASASLQTVPTVASVPTRLALSVSPPNTLQSGAGEDALVTLELVNGSSLPASAGNYTQVIITSSNTSVVDGTIKATIPPGMSYAYFHLKAKNPGTTTLTALSGGLATASTGFSILPLPLSVSLVASPNPTSANQSAAIIVDVSLAGQGLSGSDVSLSSNIGVITPPRSTTDEGGRMSAIFISTGSGVAIITANINHPYIGRRNATLALIVSQAPTPVVHGPMEALYPFVPVIIALAIVVVLVMAVWRVLRRRRASTEEEDEL